MGDQKWWNFIFSTPN